MGRPGLAPALIAAAAVAVIGASTGYAASRAADSEAAATPERTLAAARCAWYSPTADGQMVIVSATGAACGDPPLADWLASMTRATWYSTGYVGGLEIAQLGRAGVTVRIYQAGSSRATEDRAGYLADDLEAAGWLVELAPRLWPVT